MEPMEDYQDILVEYPGAGVMLVSLRRPDARNALRNQTLRELAAVLDAAGRDDAVRAVVIAGDDRYFAAGADIREMAGLGPIDAVTDVRPQYWKRIAGFEKPLIAAVNGYALGGGCELVMHADIAIASRGARFGKFRVFRQESVTGMHGLRAGLAAGFHDLLNNEIAFGRGRRSDEDSVIRHLDVKRIAVGFGIDGDGFDTHAPGGLDDPAGDLAAIGDQNTFEHALVYLQP